MSNSQKRIVIAGSSGFIGGHLVKFFKDCHVTTLDRTPRSEPGVTGLTWDGQTVGDWSSALEGADLLINLSGSPITVKLSEENRREILASRVESTNALAKAMTGLRVPPAVWINGSATGYYGDQGDTVLYESATSGNEFLSEVCRNWESAATRGVLPDTRLVLLRTGIVLGREGGAFKTLRKLTLFGLGGAAGSGAQWVPWVHIEDLCRMVRWAFEDDRISGPVNVCTPSPVRNRELMQKLRNELNRPWSPPAPGFLLKLMGQITGPNAELLLESFRVIPRTAIDHGFTWTHPNVGEALENLVHTKAS